MTSMKEKSGKENSMLKAMKVYAEYVSGIETKFGLEYIPEEGCYYGLPEDIDEAAKHELRIAEALVNGDVEYV